METNKVETNKSTQILANKVSAINKKLNNVENQICEIDKQLSKLSKDIELIKRVLKR